MSLPVKLVTHTPQRRYPKWMVGKPLLYSSSAMASLGDAMFGYSQGVIAGAQIHPSFIKRMYGVERTLQQVQSGGSGVNPILQAIVVACLNITALISSLLSSYICDALGRRIAIRLGAFIYLISAFIQIFMPNLATLFVGRIIQGLAVGTLSMTVPILQCEIAPSHARGLFVAIEYLFLNLGYAASAWVGYGFFAAIPSEMSWRGPYIIQAGLAIILFLWTFYLPESPRWLIQRGYRDEALQVIADLHGTGDVNDTSIISGFVDMETTIILENTLGEPSWVDLLKQYPQRVLVGVTCQQFAQTNGINALLYFLPEMLAHAGFSVREALLYTGGCALVYCAGTLPTMVFVDKWGRRKLLMAGSVGLCMCLAVVGAIQFRADKLGSQSRQKLPTGDGLYAAVCVYLFIFGASWGPIPWLLSTEIFLIRARAKGAALSTATNWLFNFVLAFVTPPLYSVMHGGFYFLLFTSCALSGIVVYYKYPETRGRTLEELGEVFGDQAIVETVHDKVAAVHEEGTQIVNRELGVNGRMEPEDEVGGDPAGIESVVLIPARPNGPGGPETESEELLLGEETLMFRDDNEIREDKRSSMSSTTTNLT